MSRGTIDWRFADKKTLYRAVVEYVQTQAVMTKYAGRYLWNVLLEPCLDRIFLLTIHDNRYVDFLYKAIAFAADKEEFQDTLDLLVGAKQALHGFFTEKCRRHIVEHGITGKEPAYYADMLFLLLEGMFMMKNLNVSIDLSTERIQQYVHAAMADLLCEEDTRQSP